jgi:glycosyltransferase involved in cell wall biosynthesis
VKDLLEEKGFFANTLALGVTDAPFDTQLSGCDMVEVAILMCTYNGMQFLAEQLNSFERQTHLNWTLCVSDDGSQDGTLEFLRNSNIHRKAGRLRVVMGPQRGFVANFLSLTCRAEIHADFYAWSDQDDIWKEDKLQKALAWLQTIPSHTPALYSGRTELICESGTPCGYSPKFSRPPHFSNALVQNMGGGNTMVFNQAARALLQEAGDSLVVPSHDWWAYQLISGAGGAVYYDPEPMVLYRQHDENLIGTNSSWVARLQRLRMVFQGRFCEWNDQNIHALETMHRHLSPEHQVTLGQFKAARSQNLLLRIAGFKQAGLYRQTLFGNLGLILATLLKKI